MAKVVFNDALLRRLMIVEMEKRGLESIILYKRNRRANAEAGYPFASKPGRRAAGVKRMPNGVQVFAESPGAVFEELGNDAKPEITPKNPRERLWLQLKNSNPSGLHAGSKAAIRRGRNGKFYLVLKKVRTYSGKHYLEKAVRQAFRVG